MFIAYPATCMITQEPISKTRPEETGLMVTEEMIIKRFTRTLQVYGRDRALNLLDDYQRILNVFPGWEVTMTKLEDILVEYDNKTLHATTYEAGELPPALSTPQAMELWHRAQEAGYVDEDFQPLISRTQAALLADAMAERLGIKEKWKVFEELWNRKYMRSDYNLALTRRGSLDFQDELKRLFSS